MRLRTVLCPVDFTPLSDQALELAIESARRFDARLVLEHNLDPRPPGYLSVTWMWSEENEPDQERQGESAEERLQRYLGSMPLEVQPQARLTRGPVAPGLMLLAAELPADLLVMASHGRSSSEHHSLTEDIICNAPCPVLALAERYVPADDGPQGPVLVPVDLSPHSATTLHLALDLAHSLERAVHLLHVVPERKSSAARSESLRRLEDLLPAGSKNKVELHARAGDPVDQIMEATNEIGAGLLVMGSHPKGRLARWFTGATACEVLHRSRRPIWFVPAQASLSEHVTS